MDDTSVKTPALPDPEENAVVQKFASRARARSKAASLLSVHKDEYRERKKAWQDKVRKTMEVASRTPSSVLRGAIGDSSDLESIRNAYSDDKEARKQYRYSVQKDRLEKERQLVERHQSNRSLGLNLGFFNSMKQRSFAEESPESAYAAFKAAAEKKRKAKDLFQKEWSS